MSFVMKLNDKIFNSENTVIKKVNSIIFSVLYGRETWSFL